MNAPLTKILLQLFLVIALRSFFATKNNKVRNKNKQNSKSWGKTIICSLIDMKKCLETCGWVRTEVYNDVEKLAKIFVSNYRCFIMIDS